MCVCVCVCLCFYVCVVYNRYMHVPMLVVYVFVCFSNILAKRVCTTGICMYPCLPDVYSTCTYQRYIHLHIYMSRCEKTREKSAKASILTDEHPPNKFRVIGTLSQVSRGLGFRVKWASVLCLRFRV